MKIDEVVGRLEESVSWTKRSIETLQKDLKYGNFSMAYQADLVEDLSSFEEDLDYFETLLSISLREQRRQEHYNDDREYTD